MMAMLGLGRERCSEPVRAKDLVPESTPDAERRAVRVSARSARSRPVWPSRRRASPRRTAGRRASRVPALVLSSVLVRPRARIAARTAGWARTEARREGRARIGALPAAPEPGGGRRAGPARRGALAGARRGVHARASASVQLSARALAVAPAVRGPARGVAPRLVGVRWRAAASTADRRTRAACPLRVHRSGGVVGGPSACPSFRPRPRAHPRTRARPRGPRARTGGGTRCRSRRSSARSR